MRVISGVAGGIRLNTPDGLSTRPTADRVKEALFSIIQFEIAGGKVLDLFGGSGQLGIEALSRGASYATFIDSDKNACGVIRDNLKRTKFTEKASVICTDYREYLSKCMEKYQIIFLDPPYAEHFLEQSLKMITEIDILQYGGIIVTERPFGKEIPGSFPGFLRSKDYKYGKTVLTIYRKKDLSESDRI